MLVSTSAKEQNNMARWLFTFKVHVWNYWNTKKYSGIEHKDTFEFGSVPKSKLSYTYLS